jgi:hypothetical protein
MPALLLEDERVMEVQESGFVSNTSTSMLLGASPDAFIKTKQGVAVAVECKGPCPFKGYAIASPSLGSYAVSASS